MAEVITRKWKNGKCIEETRSEIYCGCEDGVFYYCGEFQDIHKFMPGSEILKIERMGVSYT